MKILILGATGFLGSSLFSLALAKRDLIVYGTSRYSNENPNIIQVDVTNKPSIEKTFKLLKPEVVIWSLMDGEKENVLIDMGLSNLLEVIQAETKLIFLSTDALFVGGRGDYIESDQPGLLPGDTPLSTYVNAKNRAENMIKNKHFNHVIIRTGPLYGEDANKNIEQRTQSIIMRIQEKQYIEAATNLYKTFVHVEDLSEAIYEISITDLKGIIHVGPKQKESYYSFFVKRLQQLGYDHQVINSYTIKTEKVPHLPLNTSLNTQKASKVLKTHFRNV